MEAHEGSTIDELVVSFDFAKDDCHVIDKWLDFALARSVKHLVLDFFPIASCHGVDGPCCLPDNQYSPGFPLPLKITNVCRYKTLMSLSTRWVNVSG